MFFSVLNKNVFIFIVIYLLHISSLYAETALFILTMPPGAVVEVDGLSHGTSPLLIKGMEKGDHSLNFILEGYEDMSRTIELVSDTPQELTVSLISRYVNLSIPDTQQAADSKEKLMSIPYGQYSIIRGANGIELTPKYPRQALISGLNISIPLMASFSAALTVNELQNPHYSRASLSPFVIGTYILNALMVGLDSILHIHKSKYITLAAERITTDKENNKNARELYDSAGEKLQSGDFTSALNDYVTIISNYRNTIFHPLALYKRGQIHMILSREDLAEKDFLTIINKMPLAELYDGCFWNLAEISLHNSEFTLALTRLDQILNVDESITPEIVQNRYNEILKLQKEKRNAISPDTNPTDPVNPDASSESPQMSLDETETNQSVEDQNAFPSLE